MKGVAIEQWSYDLECDVKEWLRETYGPENKEVWYVEQDFDLFGLIMRDDIYLMYLLKWYSKD